MKLASILMGKLLSGLAAAILSFLIAGGALLLAAGPLEGWVFLALFAAGPAIFLATLPFKGRAFCFLLGMLVFAGSLAVDLGGPDSPMITLPWMALCFAGAAAMADLCVRAVQRMLRPKLSEA